MIADFWLAHDPNDPGDPDPDREKHDLWANAKRFNFDEGGTSQYQIDVDDLVVIAHDWAWIACWKQSQLNLSENMMEMMTMGGGEGMMMMPLAFGFAALPAEPEPEPVERTTAELVSLVEGIYGIIEYVDESIEENHENAEGLFEIKAFLEGVLRDLQNVEKRLEI